MSSSTQRALRVLKALRGHTINGISNSQLAATLQESPTNITRALQDLITEGFVIKLDNGLFALSVSCLQIAVAHSEEMERAISRINELKQRVAASSYKYFSQE